MRRSLGVLPLNCTPGFADPNENRVAPEVLARSPDGESTAEVAERVAAARARQLGRQVQRPRRAPHAPLRASRSTGPRCQ